MRMDSNDVNLDISENGHPNKISNHCCKDMSISSNIEIPVQLDPSLNRSTISNQNRRNSMIVKSSEDGEVNCPDLILDDVENSIFSMEYLKGRQWCRYLTILFFVGFVLAAIGVSILSAYFISSKPRKMRSPFNYTTQPEAAVYQKPFDLTEVVANRDKVWSTTTTSTITDPPTAVESTKYLNEESRVVSLDLTFVNSGDDVYGFSDILIRSGPLQVRPGDADFNVITH